MVKIKNCNKLNKINVNCKLLKMKNNNHLRFDHNFFYYYYYYYYYDGDVVCRTGDGDVDLPGAGCVCVRKFRVGQQLRGAGTCERLHTDTRLRRHVHQSHTLAGGVSACHPLHIKRHIIHTLKVGLEIHTHT